MKKIMLEMLKQRVMALDKPNKATVFEDSFSWGGGQFEFPLFIFQKELT